MTFTKVFNQLKTESRIEVFFLKKTNEIKSKFIQFHGIFGLIVQFVNFNDKSCK